MFEALETGAGLDLILRLQEMRFGAMDFLAEFLDFAGEELVYIAVIGLIYWAFNKSFGLKMYFALITIVVLTLFFKDALGRPRPYDVSDAVMPLFEDIGNGIPSGHTGMTVMVFGYLAYHIRKLWVTVLVVFYIMLQGFGRMYAGVHFPQDVIAGLILGAVTLAVYIPLTDPIGKWWQAQHTAIQIGLPLVLGLALMVIYPADEGMVTIAGLLAFAGIAIWLEQNYVKFVHDESAGKRAAQYMLALVLTILAVEGLDIAFGETESMWVAAVLRFIRYGLTIVVALALIPFISVRLGLMGSTVGIDKPNLTPTKTM